MESVVGGTEAHLCVMDDAGTVASICEQPFLTKVRAVDPGAAKCCEECKKIWMSGEEIAFVGGAGEKVVVRKKCPPLQQGTTDNFEDLVQKLRESGACYFLMVAMQGERRIHHWTNLVNFGHGAIDLFEETSGEVITAAREKRFLVERNGSA